MSSPSVLWEGEMFPSSEGTAALWLLTLASASEWLFELSFVFFELVGEKLSESLNLFRGVQHNVLSIDSAGVEVAKGGLSLMTKVAVAIVRAFWCSNAVRSTQRAVCLCVVVSDLGRGPSKSEMTRK